LKDASFGERWVAGERPERFEHVFASVQSLQNVDLSNLAVDHFDMVIVDEFHHAAAASYDRLLQHVQPRELLGLTATPERSDGLPVLQWFGDRIAAELRLWDAIDQHYLSPFLYYGIHDGLDLREVPWRRGRGYDVEGLTNLYTSSDAWARRVIKETRDRAENLSTMRALGFCVSVEHARYMARIFEESGIRSVAIWGGTAAADRAAALGDLSAGDLKVVFSVDVFNEGVDVPAVDTLLLLRPTDSPTLFLQQLGRGLRRTNDKSVCTVLDFVGHHRREFRFDRRFRALLGGTRKDVERQVEDGFPFLPAGCHMELDPVAADVVLQSIRDSVPSRWSRKVEELRAFVDTDREARLADYLDHSGLELADVYSGGRSWSDLCEAADVATQQSGSQERTLRRAIGRLLHVDDEVRLDSYLRLLEEHQPPSTESMNERDRRLARMLVSQIVGQAVDKSVSLDQGLGLLWSHPQVRSELGEVLEVLREGLDHLPIPLEERADVPLQVHARYSRLEILAAFGVGEGASVAAWQTGVRWVPEASADLFAFTLDKTEGAFSPTTRYRDYAVSRELIHWESQSVTRADSPTGRRYVEHVQRGSDVFLFGRVRRSERAFWFLGPATYVEHTGERPMAVIWKLRHRLPGDLFAAFAAAVA
jgi:superfamily II DNA or RNA helicase